MQPITDFVALRADGQRHTEAMGVAELAALGPPSIVIALAWRYGGAPVELRFPAGVLARVVPGRAFVAALVHTHPHDCGELSLWRADGTRAATLANTLPGSGAAGRFLWFEPARTPRAHTFGVVFERAGDRALFQCDFDAPSGAMVAVTPTR